MRMVHSAKSLQYLVRMRVVNVIKINENKVFCDVQNVYTFSSIVGRANMFSSSITNINTDCRELIFEHLEFNDLVNIADTSKQFYSTVCLVYKRKYVNMNPMFIDIMSSR